MIRTKSLAKGPDPQTYINIETYSIGFTALYFWVIFAVTLTSAIGTSQTANSIPNILKGFSRNLTEAFPDRTIKLPRHFDDEERYRLGGIYSWQPDGASEGFQNRPWFCTVLPLFSVAFGTGIGMGLTSLVPSVGWSCRSTYQISIVVIWLVSYPCTLIP